MVCISSAGTVRCIRAGSAVRQEAIAKSEKASASYMQHVLTCCGFHPNSLSEALRSVSQLRSHNRNGARVAGARCRVTGC